MAEILRLEAGNDVAVGALRELVDVLTRFSDNTAAHFMPTVPKKPKPSIHFMAAPEQPGSLIVKTWQPDSSGGQAVVAKIFKISRRRIGSLVSELDSLVVRTRANVAVNSMWLALSTGEARLVREAG